MPQFFIDRPVFAWVLAFLITLRGVIALTQLLLPNSNALDVMKAVREKMAALQPSFPPGVSWFVPFDSTTFIRIAIHEVIITLVEAVALVFIAVSALSSSTTRGARPRCLSCLEAWRPESSSQALVLWG